MVKGPSTYCPPHAMVVGPDHRLCLADIVESLKETCDACLYLRNGTYIIDPDNLNAVLGIGFTLTIIGESRDGCKIMGGLSIVVPEKDVWVRYLTICESKEAGISIFAGTFCNLDHVFLYKSGGIGIVVCDSKCSIIDCEVSNSKCDGLLVHGNGSMVIEGAGTTIHHNNTNEDPHMYGLHVCSANDSILIVSPLTKEIISTNNGGGGNYGSDSTNSLLMVARPVKAEDLIFQGPSSIGYLVPKSDGIIKTIEQQLPSTCPKGAVVVYPGKHSLLNAVKEAKENDCLFLLNGIHDEEGDSVDIKISICDRPIFDIMPVRKLCSILYSGTHARNPAASSYTGDTRLVDRGERLSPVLRRVEDAIVVEEVLVVSAARRDVVRRTDRGVRAVPTHRE